MVQIEQVLWVSVIGLTLFGIVIWSNWASIKRKYNEIKANYLMIRELQKITGQLNPKNDDIIDVPRKP